MTSSNKSQIWDLAAYDGLEISILEGGDRKRYTLTLKDDAGTDEDVDVNAGGRDSGDNDDGDRDDDQDDQDDQDARNKKNPKSGISWEWTFTGKEGTVFAAWDEFRAMYRGREMDRSKGLELKTGRIQRFGVMMRR